MNEIDFSRDKECPSLFRQPYASPGCPCYSLLRVKEGKWIKSSISVGDFTPEGEFHWRKNK